MRPRAIDRETVMPTYMYDAAGYRGIARHCGKVRARVRVRQGLYRARAHIRTYVCAPGTVRYMHVDSARIHPTVDVAEGSLLTFRQLHAVILAESLAPIDIALSSTPPVACTVTSHAITRVRHFSLDSRETLPACHTHMH